MSWSLDVKYICWLIVPYFLLPPPPSLATTTPLRFYGFGYFRCIHKWDQASYFAILPYSLLLSPRQLNMSHPPFAWGSKLSPQNHQRWMKDTNLQFLRSKPKEKLIIQETHNNICPLWYQEGMLAQNTDGLRTSVPPSLHLPRSLRKSHILEIYGPVWSQVT